MRMSRPLGVKLSGAAHPLEFSGTRGERLTISVLDHDLIRVQHWPDGSPRLDRTWTVIGQGGDVPREGRRRGDLSPFALPDFALDVNDQRVQVQTARLQIEASLGDFALRWSALDRAGSVFAADVPKRAYAYDRAGKTIFHFVERREGELYYGFGERSGSLNKAGRRMRMVNVDALGYNAERGDPLYKHIPFYITFNPALGIAYGLFYDNLSITTFDMGLEIDAYYPAFRTYRAEDGDLDYTLIYGPSIPEVVEKFAALTGRMALPPRWSLGYLGSTMSYTEVPDAQEQLKRFVVLCAEHEIPCDLFHLSSGYSTGADGKRYVFTWNRERVPDPQAMVDHFHEAGIHLAPNIKPCLLTTHPRYAEVAALGGFVKQAESDQPEINMFWGGEGSHLDFTNPAAYAWWQENVTQALLDYGIDATWNDNNEYEIWDDEARCHGFGEPTRIGLLRSVQTLLMVRASYEAQRAARPDERPFVLSRSGCPGIQRYAQTWSGDNFTSWETLRYNIPMGLGLSLSGVPNTGHDVGGFYGPRPEPELFVRWVQNGIFHPRFCIHSYNTDGTVNEPWMYPDVLPIVRDLIRFRYRLIPYLYTLLFEAAQTGHPIIRPMVYAFPHDARCHTESFDFMLGPNLLVASVLDDGARTRSVYLPSGTAWCDFHTGVWYEGGQTVKIAAPLERIPFLVPAGGMIPMGPLPKSLPTSGEGLVQPDDEREVYVFPGGNDDGEFTLIEDDGISLGYQRGEYSEVRLRVSAQPDQIGLAAEVTREGYPLPYRAITFVLPEGETRPTADPARETVVNKRRRVTVAVTPAHTR